MDLRGRNLIAHLFDVDTEHVESLSWPLGSRVTVDAGAESLFRLAHRRSARTVTAFEVTDYTCILRLRTPSVVRSFTGSPTPISRPIRPGPTGFGRTDTVCLSPCPGARDPRCGCAGTDCQYSV